jgi:hypothetical protein
VVANGRTGVARIVLSSPRQARPALDASLARRTRGGRLSAGDAPDTAPRRRAPDRHDRCRGVVGSGAPLRPRAAVPPVRRGGGCRLGRVRGRRRPAGPRGPAPRRATISAHRPVHPARAVGRLSQGIQPASALTPGVHTVEWQHLGLADGREPSPVYRSSRVGSRQVNGTMAAPLFGARHALDDAAEADLGAGFGPAPSCSPGTSCSLSTRTSRRSASTGVNAVRCPLGVRDRGDPRACRGEDPRARARHAELEHRRRPRQDRVDVTAATAEQLAALEQEFGDLLVVSARLRPLP